MKRYLILPLLAICITAWGSQAHQADALAGAWHMQQGDIQQTAVFVDGYLSHSTYDVKNKKFIATRGGTYDVADGKLTVTWQYDSEKAANETPVDTWLGQTSTFAYKVANTLTTDLSGSEATWQRIDNNEGPMAGVWYMSGRKQGDELAQRTLQDRRTLKILSGKRFQWVAINIKTGQFSGTGGGTYTFGNGKYTENIEFFSRGGDRVGMSLPFDDQIIDGQWHHTGKSSAGDPMYEIWSRLNGDR
ncbi:hypothetical protein SAMN05660226_01885 [Parapedobacter luteus]|uniref:Membrane or secreted protein n=1 Tax=Parapedobacter luteus TaxID=623280 RepID=A0A1T5C659_9SPHI|nr:hypothetical protein [Parapedobacter luteus]SKB54866.1 hypothetical protein SAMN05660226_01885 [Parapedobacter luteus]